MSDFDTLMADLSPLQAQAFFQNDSLQAGQAIQLAMRWLEQGIEDIDVAVLASSTSDQWADIKPDFLKAMAALGIGTLQERDAEIARLNILLNWVRRNEDTWSRLDRLLSAHCPELVMLFAQRAPPKGEERLINCLHGVYWRWEDYFELSCSINVPPQDLTIAQNSLRYCIEETLRTIAEDYPQLTGQRL